ncbi:MAG TPA: GAF domain-containing protein [Candidatus Limnocylindrales bacterium]|nr:GAF domain-containing protein [Candidatus Limnocylindrales bacterium]
MSVPHPSRPVDATLSVASAARVLGVHPNTIRSWSDQGRLRYYRINDRGDRRYRLSDLQRFLASMEVSGRTNVEGELAHRAGRLPDRHLRPLETRRQFTPTFEPSLIPAGDGRWLEMELLARVTVLAGATGDPARALHTVLAETRSTLGLSSVSVWELRGGAFLLRAADGTLSRREVPAGPGVLARAVGSNAPATDPGGEIGLAVPIVSGGRSYGALAFGDPAGTTETPTAPFASVLGGLVGAMLGAMGTADDAARRMHHARALRRVAADLAGRLDLNRVIADVIDHAIVLFEADRAAIFLAERSGRFTPAQGRGLTDAFMDALREASTEAATLGAPSRPGPMQSPRYADDPRARELRAAVVQEGIGAACAVRLHHGEETLGVLVVYHDEPRSWSDDDLESMSLLAGQAAAALAAARDYGRMEAWAAQLASLQQLGARLNRLSDEIEIAEATASELHGLIDSHNVRVYRVRGDELVPVAMRGQVGEYEDETPDQLKLRLGQGITGWVAVNGTPAYLPDAAADPRAQTIPGTDSDLDESMLLAPMVFEDRVLGVLVLSKLGLDQFRDDDLRLLVIYASFAAQAFANADATSLLRERSIALERQVRGQRELLSITESIVSTLDARAVFDQVVERLSGLIRFDNIAIEIRDRQTGGLRPIIARGASAEWFLQPWLPGETGLATWVVEHNEPQLVQDEATDQRVLHEGKPIEGSLICVPLRGREGAVGVLTLERLGTNDRFSEEEYELAQLFAAQVSIALQNAEVFRAVETRARTDDLTGLLNQGAFRDELAARVGAGNPFSLIMVDLDDFKGVNDALGHQAGDRFLRAVAASITEASRESDLVYRYGGDEFTVLLPETETVGARAVAERVMAAIRSISDHGTRWSVGGVRASASIGVASLPNDGLTAEEVLLSADRALFAAKRQGRDRVATAADGLALAAEFTLTAPTPVDEPTIDLADQT